MRKWDLNLLVLVGAVLGIFSLFMPWYTVTYGHPYVPGEPSVIDLVISPSEVLSGEVAVRDYSGLPNASSLYLMILFFVGALLAVFSPLCGLIQVFAAPLFLLSCNGDIGLTLRHDTVGVEYGAWVALVSSAMVFAGLLLPVSVRSRRFSRDVSNRLFTFIPQNILASRLNILAFVGAVVCVFSLALPWATLSSSSSAGVSVEYASSYLSGGLSSTDATIPSVTAADATVLFLVSVLVVGGSFVAFVSPLGCVSVLAGVALFYYEMRVFTDTYLSVHYPMNDWRINYGLGFGMSVAGGIILVLSMIHPVGLQPGMGKVPFPERLLVWGLEAGPSEHREAPPQGVPGPARD